MTNWAKLQDAYGSADEIPNLIAELSPSQESDVWQELWGRLCHQGTVYSASFAALPSLTEAAAKWPPRERLMALSLCGGIIAARDGAASGETLRSLWEPLLPKLNSLSEESLGAKGWPHVEYLYLLKAWLAFDREWFWADRVEDLADKEVSLSCPSCGRDIIIAIRSEDCFVTNEDYVRNPGASRNPVEPAKPESLSGTSLRLYGWAFNAGQELVEKALLNLCGTTNCPACGTEIKILETLKVQKKLM